jgi:hypothetical protein
MAGSSPAMTTEGRSASRQRLVKILPLQVHAMDRLHLPRPRPVLHVLLVLDRIADVVEEREPDEMLEPVALGEAFAEALPMLPGPARQVCRHADVQRAVRPVCHHVDPAAHDRQRRKTWMAGSSPAMTAVEHSSHVMPGLEPGIHALQR